MGAALVARRLSSRMAVAIGSRERAVARGLHPDVPRARYPAARHLDSGARDAPVLDHAGARPRPDVEQLRAGALHGTFRQDRARLLGHPDGHLPTRSALFGSPRVGASWEGFAVEQVLAAVRPSEAYFWATYGRAELDLLFVLNGMKFGVEMKFSEAPEVTRSMRIARDDLSLEHLWVVHPGRHSYQVDERISVYAITDIGELASDVDRRSRRRRSSSTAARRTRGATPRQ